jgi:hypothetical protein
MERRTRKKPIDSSDSEGNSQVVTVNDWPHKEKVHHSLHGLLEQWFPTFLLSPTP